MKSKITITAVIFTLGFVTLPLVWGDSDFRWTDAEHYRGKSSGVNAPDNERYKAECASCHMAYPPGLLPARSWEKIMTNLDNHFGDNAVLDAKSLDSISQFLVSNSADQSDYRRSQSFNNSIKSGEVPERITETRYFLHKHDEVPARMVQDNPKVGRFSNCIACHAAADKGHFNEDDIRIPGFGRWDD